MGRRKSWEPVIQKIEIKLSSWKADSLSIGGRLTLVNAVLGSLPLYHLSIFRAPLSVVRKIEVLRNKFFWGSTGEQKKIVWARIEKLFATPKRGGLAVASLRAKNLGLLEKWKWRWLKEPQSL